MKVTVKLFYDLPEELAEWGIYLAGNSNRIGISIGLEREYFNLSDNPNLTLVNF